MGFYNVRIDGVEYKCQGYSRSDAVDCLSREYMPGRANTDRIGDHFNADTEIECEEND
ncbi:MAG: hypothetical protein PHF64_00930 [Methanoregula sp.]|nr:hypothetical protein [Methanoregula sp.]